MVVTLHTQKGERRARCLVYVLLVRRRRKLTRHRDGPSASIERVGFRRRCGFMRTGASNASQTRAVWLVWGLGSSDIKPCGAATTWALSSRVMAFACRQLSIASCLFKRTASLGSRVPCFEIVFVSPGLLRSNRSSSTADLAMRLQHDISGLDVDRTFARWFLSSATL
jgi:hypothetical protein